MASRHNKAAQFFREGGKPFGFPIGGRRIMEACGDSTKNLPLVFFHFLGAPFSITSGWVALVFLQRLLIFHTYP